MTFWSIFFSVLAGILAGVGINIGIDMVRACINRKRTVKNLKFEIIYNLGKLNLFLEELDKFHKKVTENAILEYYGYFPLSRIIQTTIVQMFLDRSIYKILEDEQIGKLQDFYTSFNVNTEKVINDQIIWAKEHIADTDIKQRSYKTINFWKYTFETRKKDLESVKESLK